MAATSVEVVAAYCAAPAVADFQRMHSLRSDDFVLDFVHQDASQHDPLVADETERFWPVWFRAFPDGFDHQVTRAVAAADAVVTEWAFTGTNSGPLDPPILTDSEPATGRTIRFRAVSVYDIVDGLIARETMYLDLATLMVDLGIDP